MSQQLIPINGGITPEVQTTVSTPSLNILSPQYVEVKNLQDRPTEWITGGRPIYRRLPAVSETYQIDFFNVVNESNILGNSFVDRTVSEVGYVFIPYGQGINGPSSCEVVASDTNKDLLIKAGNIVWKYGKTQVFPTIVNLEVLKVLSGKYTVAYQLIYDDAPVPHLYEVSDFALTGIPLNITASTDDIIGWRYSALNAFLNTDTLFWGNRDTLFPSYADPSFTTGYVPFLQWESDLGHAYSTITLRCPTGTAFIGTASLSYVDGSTLVPVTTATIESDTTGQFFQLKVDSPVLQTGWNISFSDPTIAIQSVTVSGVLTLLESQSALAPKTTLVMYPFGTLPATVTNSQGEKIPATYCQLANVDISDDRIILDIRDVRNIIHRDFVPVADWLTLPFDQDLINLYEQVETYSSSWMSPTSTLNFEYQTLETDQITVVP